MSKKCGHKRNLMTVERLLTHIAKYANELTKHLKEAQQIIKSNFPMVQGMPSGDKCTPEFAVHVLMDCDGNLIDCDHQVYGKEQNISLSSIISCREVLSSVTWASSASFTGCDGRLAWLLREYVKPSQDLLRICK